MKLGKLDTDRNVKLVVSIPESVSTDLDAYAKCYQQEHGVEVPQSRLVAEMLRKFMQEDSDFQRHLRVTRQPAKPAAKATSEGEASAAPAVAPAVVPSFVNADE